MDISQHTEVQPCSCSIITQSLNKAPKTISPGKASHQAPGSLLPTEPLLMEKASSTKMVIKGEGGMRNRRGGREVGSTCPPSWAPAQLSVSCQCPQRQTLVLVRVGTWGWYRSPIPKGIAYPPKTGKKGHLGEMPSIICSLRVLDHTYK